MLRMLLTVVPMITMPACMYAGLCEMQVQSTVSTGTGKMVKGAAHVQHSSQLALCEHSQVCWLQHRSR